MNRGAVKTVVSKSKTTPLIAINRVTHGVIRSALISFIRAYLTLHRAKAARQIRSQSSANGIPAARAD